MVWLLGLNDLSTGGLEKKGSGGAEAIAQGLHLAGEVQHFRQFTLRGLQHATGKACGAGLEFAAGCGEPDQYAAFVLHVAKTAHEVGGFEALEQGRERARIEVQALAEFGNRDAVVFPQHEHGQVLRVGEAHVLEQRFVELGHGQRGRIQREAELVVELQDLIAGEAGRVHGDEIYRTIKFCSIKLLKAILCWRFLAAVEGRVVRAIRALSRGGAASLHSFVSSCQVN